jgi:hypothetical protein
MPVYDPPDAHFAYIDIPEYDVDTVFMFIGKDGWRFKKLTRDLGVSYIYYHPESKRISVHGAWSAMVHMPCNNIVKQLSEFVEHVKTCPE